MISFFNRFCTIVFSITLFLNAGDINSTLVDANSTIYNTLLKSISKQKENNDEVLLQKVLLKKLIDTSRRKFKKEKNIELPQNPKEYRLLFDKFIQNAIKEGSLKARISEIGQKIKILKTEIKGIKNSAPSFLSLELQYAFYIKTKKLYEKQVDLEQKKQNEIASILSSITKHIKFNIVIIDKDIDYYTKDLSKIKNEISKLQVEKERIEFLDNSNKQISKINSLIIKRTGIYQKLLRNAITSLFLKFSYELKEKNKEAFATEKKISVYVKKLKYANSISNAVNPLLNRMEKQYLGALNVITSSTTQEARNIIISFWHLVTRPLFEINSSPISIMKILISILVFILGFYLGGFYKVNIKKVTQNIDSINSTTSTIFSNLGYYLIIVIAFILALNVLGINLSSIGLVAGALSVGIGFGLQNIVSNFISGIILMFEKSIKIGDYIELSEDLKGHVTGINMRSTTINTNSNIDVIVPNQNFIQNNVINWTMNDKIRRFQIPFGVAYGTKPQMVVDIIKDAVKNSGFKDVIDTPQRHSRVIMVSMGSSSVDFELFVWIKGLETLYPKRTTSRFLVLVYDALYANNIEIPFPQQDLHIRSVDENVKFQITSK